MNIKLLHFGRYYLLPDRSSRPLKIQTHSNLIRACHVTAIKIVETENSKKPLQLHPTSLAIYKHLQTHISIIIHCGLPFALIKKLFHQPSEAGSSTGNGSSKATPVKAFGKEHWGVTSLHLLKRVNLQP